MANYLDHTGGQEMPYDETERDSRRFEHKPHEQEPDVCPYHKEAYTGSPQHNEVPRHYPGQGMPKDFGTPPEIVDHHNGASTHHAVDSHRAKASSEKPTQVFVNDQDGRLSFKDANGVHSFDLKSSPERKFGAHSTIRHNEKGDVLVTLDNGDRIFASGDGKHVAVLTRGGKVIDYQGKLEIRIDHNSRKVLGLDIIKTGGGTVKYDSKGQLDDIPKGGHKPQERPKDNPTATTAEASRQSVEKPPEAPQPKVTVDKNGHWALQDRSGKLHTFEGENLRSGQVVGGDGPQAGSCEVRENKQGDLSIKTWNWDRVFQNKDSGEVTVKGLDGKEQTIKGHIEQSADKKTMTVVGDDGSRITYKSDGSKTVVPRPEAPPQQQAPRADASQRPKAPGEIPPQHRPSGDNSQQPHAQSEQSQQQERQPEQPARDDSSKRGAEEEIPPEKLPERPVHRELEPVESPEVWQERLKEAAARHLSDATRFMADVEEFSKSADKQGLTPEEKARTYKEIVRLLDANVTEPVNQHDRNKLAEQIMDQLARPTTIDQGNHPTCTVTSLESMMYTITPFETVRSVVDLATKGEYVTRDGKVVKLYSETANPDGTTTKTYDSSLRADREAKETLKDGVAPNDQTLDVKRSFASQLFQVAAVNTFWANSDTLPDGKGTKVPPGSIRYVQREDGQARLMNMSTQPPSKIKDRAGQPYTSPHLSMQRVAAIYQGMTGKDPEGHFLAVNSKVKNDGGEKHGGVLYVKTQEQLQQRLAELKKTFPIVIEVDAQSLCHTDQTQESGTGAKAGASIDTLLGPIYRTQRHTAEDVVLAAGAAELANVLAPVVLGNVGGGGGGGVDRQDNLPSADTTPESDPLERTTDELPGNKPKQPQVEEPDPTNPNPPDRETEDSERHCVTLRDYVPHPDPGSVGLDNQWGQAADHLGQLKTKPRVGVKKLFEMMRYRQ